MTAWLLLVAFYWWAGCMAGVFPGLRLRHARRLRGTVRFHERVYKRWDSPKRRRMHDGMEEQASNLERRWTRASRFGWWILVAVTAQWFYALAMATEFGDGSDSGTTRQGMAWFSSVIMTCASFLVVGVLVLRYRSGEDRPFATATLYQKAAYGGAVAAALLAVLVYSNAPLDG